MELSVASPNPVVKIPLDVRFPNFLHTAAGLNITAGDLAE